ncbi:putative E3 ubiquitin-protein ligase HERC6 [Planoprotostelium fungivorum]|uniref:Putative E3 ubiquitin-protein ligase HERC6 n=1 Tax=Planoprotostelium fungivorum TaxID=1890364 RepID=A0A2P6MUL4_9EUKA|nr:putative E3 ubiquitin-protein ligase HERC6 [Planoprotostelium fungivorum]
MHSFRQTVIFPRQHHARGISLWKRVKEIFPSARSEDISLIKTRSNPSDEIFRLYSWGNGFNGQLGLGVPEDKTTPTVVPDLRNDHITSASCGVEHAVAISAAGYGWAWGGNSHMQIGSIRHFFSEELFAPTAISNLWNDPIRKVSCGWYHSLAILRDGQIKSWGNNCKGQLGTGNRFNFSEPQPLSLLSRKDIVDLSCGALHSVAITREGQIYSWSVRSYMGFPLIFNRGFNGSGQLGLTGSADVLRPTLVELSMKIQRITCGSFHTQVQDENGDIYILGGPTGIPHLKERPHEPYSLDNHATMTYRSEPIKVDGLHHITQFAAGYNFGAAIDANGAIYVWSIDKSQPLARKVDFKEKVKSLTLSPTHCTVISDISSGNSPQEVVGPKDKMQVHAGWDFHLLTARLSNEETADIQRNQESPE